jgi:hypothetical protein
MPRTSAIPVADIADIAVTEVMEVIEETAEVMEAATADVTDVADADDEVTVEMAAAVTVEIIILSPTQKDLVKYIINIRAIFCQYLCQKILLRKKIDKSVYP